MAGFVVIGGKLHWQAANPGDAPVEVTGYDPNTGKVTVRGFLGSQSFKTTAPLPAEGYSVNGVAVPPRNVAPAPAPSPQASGSSGMEYTDQQGRVWRKEGSKQVLVSDPTGQMVPGTITLASVGPNNTVSMTATGAPVSGAPMSGFQQGQIPLNPMDYKPTLEQALAQANAQGQLKLDDALALGQTQQQQGFAQAQQAGQGQMSLADALRAQMAGQGPSLAQLQLQSATDRNQQMAAGAMGAQRGINPALAARMIGNQAAGLNQQAANQSAQLRMQEQLAAQQQLAGVLAQMGQGGLGMSNAGQDLFGASGQLTLGQQGQTTQRIGTVGGLYGGQNQLAAETALAQDKIRLAALQGDQNAKIEWERILRGQASADKASTDKWIDRGLTTAGTAVAVGAPIVAAGVGGGGNQKADKDTEGGVGEDIEQSPMQLSGGGKVPGRAAVSGDSEENDIVPALLSPGEVVLPRSVADDPDQAADFVAELQNKKKQPKSYGEVLAKLKDIEGMLKR